MSKYKRIQQLCKERGISVAKMERDLGFARGSIAKIDEHKPSVERVAKICDYLCVSPMTLLINDETNIDEYNDAVAYKDAINQLPLTNVGHPVYEVSCGQGRTCSSPDSYCREEGQYAKVVGDSMFPVLHDGDVVRIIETKVVDPTDIALVKVNGDENTLKYCEVTHDGVWIRAENKDVFEDRFLTTQECLTLPVQIFGKAVEIVSRKL